MIYLSRRKADLKDYLVLKLFAIFILPIIFFSDIAFGSDFETVRKNPEQLIWSKVSDTVRYAKISGEEKTPGIYAYQVKFEKGHRNEPHYHTDDRIVTVLSGAILVGFGEKIVESEMVEVREGGSYTEPRNQPHYVCAKSSNVVLLVVGTGLSTRVSVDHER